MEVSFATSDTFSRSCTTASSKSARDRTSIFLMAIKPPTQQEHCCSGGLINRLGSVRQSKQQHYCCFALKKAEMRVFTAFLVDQRSWEGFLALASQANRCSPAFTLLDIFCGGSTSLIVGFRTRLSP